MTFHVAFEGNIGSGKSTLMAAVQPTFPSLSFFPEPVADWKFLGDFYQNPSTFALLLQVEILFSFQYAPQTRPWVTERSTESGYWCFARLLQEQGMFPPDHFRLFEQLWSRYRQQPTHLVYVKTPPALCLERVTQRNRTAETSITLEYLTALDQAHAHYIATAKENGIPVLELDGRRTVSSLQEEVTLFLRGLNPEGGNILPGRSILPGQKDSVLGGSDMVIS